MSNEKIIWLLRLVIGILILLVLVGIGFTVYVYVRYGNTPFNELPAWVIPFFIKR